MSMDAVSLGGVTTALRALAAAFEGDGTMCEIGFDLGRIADSLEKLCDCVREDVGGRAYFNISPNYD